MASLLLLLASSSTTVIVTPTSFASFRRPLFPNKSQTSSRLVVLPCKAKHPDHNNPGSNDQDAATSFREGKLDRREVLFGLGAGGLYGAAAAGLDLNRFALADPIPAPDINNCGPTTHDQKGLDCCPKKSDVPAIDFQLPDSPPPVMRTRLAAQNAANDAEYVQKYRNATALMKGLPKDDPRNFWSQANVHCAYCEGSYQYINRHEYPTEIQVHSSWLFFPFHLWYLYFYERILGHLIQDSNFALPFWNWDAPEGMCMPAIFQQDPVLNHLYDPNRNTRHRQENPLYDPKRNACHIVPGTVADLNYGCTYNTSDRKTIICHNLFTMNRQMMSDPASDWCSFFGYPYKAGDRPNQGAGRIELIPHNTIHNWTGMDVKSPQHTAEDMGVFYSAGRDPIFFAHHANVDRMWYLRRKKLNREDITDPDWLDATFLFYDERQQLVRVKVRDSLNTDLLGYNYQDVNIPWKDDDYTPRPRSNKTRILLDSSAESTTNFSLDSTKNIEVEMPKKKENPDNLVKLVIYGIEFPANEAFKFDVYVNDDAKSHSGPDNTEFAGSLVHVQQSHGKKIRTKLILCITKLLKDLKAEHDSSVVVTLVRRCGIGKITIGGLSIKYGVCPSV